MHTILVGERSQLTCSWDDLDNIASANAAQPISNCRVFGRSVPHIHMLSSFPTSICVILKPLGRNPLMIRRRNDGHGEPRAAEIVAAAMGVLGVAEA